MQTHLVIGCLGQVGTAILAVLRDKYDVVGMDRDSQLTGKFDVLHICIPWTRQFHAIVKQYKRRFLTKNGLIIIHSTVPMGTSKLLKAVHSPIRGVHPNLEAGVRTFVKYFGGPRAEEAAKIFDSLGIKTKTTSKAEETEAAKLWDTTAYGWNIILNKLIKDYCEENRLDFDLVYTQFTETYNDGYKQLNRCEVQRPVLKYMRGPIGGHCVIPNCKLLGGDAAKFILRVNRRYGVLGHDKR